MTDQEMISAGRWACLARCGNGLRFVGATDSPATTQTDNILHFEYCAVNEWIMRMLSGWVATTRLSLQNRVIRIPGRGHLFGCGL